MVDVAGICFMTLVGFGWVALGCCYYSCLWFSGVALWFHDLRWFSGVARLCIDSVVWI